MKKILYSLTTCFVLFYALAIIFGIGSYLCGIKEIKMIFKQMTNIQIWAAIEPILGSPIIICWLIVLAICGGMLFLNTMFCTKLQLAKYLKNRTSKTRQDIRQKGMAYIHIIAMVVIACHAGDILLIERHNPVKLFIGDNYDFGTYQVKLADISYITDRSVIEEDENGRVMPSFKIASDKFSIPNNNAKLIITKDDQPVKTATIGMLAPVQIGGSFIFLDGFASPQDSDEISISIHHSYNPLALPFFGVYFILFSLLIIQFFKTRYRE